MIDVKLLFSLLVKKNINYTLYNHPPLFTVDDSKRLRGKINGAHTKNLFLKNKKNNFYLFSCLESTKIDLKTLKEKLNLGNISFAGEKYLHELLNVKPGAVTPFGLLNDSARKIKFFLDLKLNDFDSFNFHPLVNTATINIKRNDFYNFLKTNTIKLDDTNRRVIISSGGSKTIINFDEISNISAFKKNLIDLHKLGVIDIQNKI